MTRQTEEEYREEQRAEAAHAEHLEQQEKETQTTNDVVNYVSKQTFSLLKDNWCYGRYYAAVGRTRYLRNDGKVFTKMQETLLDLNGGTYFLTQQEAQDCLDRYNAAQDQNNKDSTKKT